MSNSKFQAEANRQLENAVQTLETIARRERVNIFSANEAASVAHLLNRPDLFERVRATIAALTKEDLFRNAITNIVPTESDRTQPITLPTAADADRSYPLCSPASLLDHLRRNRGKHIRKCLQGDLLSAIKAARCEREVEDLGSTLAVLGQFDDAAKFIESQAIDDFRREGVNSIILLEKCRREVPDVIEMIEQSGTTGSTSIAIALVGRLPWIGYPFADW